MAGKKGRSGRKSFYEEKSLDELLNFSTNYLYQWMRSDKTDVNKKANIACILVSKKITNKHEHSGKIGVTLEQVLDDARARAAEYMAVKSSN